MVAAPPVAAIAGIPVLPSVEATIALHCPAPSKRDPRIACDHVVVKLPLALWEQAIADEVEVECRRCGTLTKLKGWR